MSERGSGPRASTFVLVVEDDGDIRSTLGDALADAGYKVVLAADVPTALEAIAGNAFGAMILDLNLGTESAETILASIDPALHASIILTTAAPSGANVASKFGVVFLRKPFDLHALLDRVASLAARDDDRGSAAS